MTIGNRPATVRADGRRPTDLRPVTFTLGVQKWAEGSCRIRVGDTEVLCAATIVDRVPPHLRGKGTGWVTARPLGSIPRAGAEELREMGRALTRRFRGKTFQEILDELARPVDPLDPLWTRSRNVLDEVVAMLRDRTLYISGATNMLDHPDLSEPATLRSMLRAFEDKARLVDLLSHMAEEQGLHVMIGGENPVEEMRGCSLITSTYSYRDQVLGVLGVVGPRRMPYTEVMSIVDETARIVSTSLSRVRQHLYLP